MGMVSATALRVRVTRLVFAGRDQAEIEAAGERYAADVLPGLLRPQMMERIAWHRERGDTLALVSGSLDAYLRPWCTRHGLDMICNRLESMDGRLTGRYLGGDRGRHKATDIRARYDLGLVPAHPRLWRQPRGPADAGPWRTSAGIAAGASPDRHGTGAR